MKYRRIAALLLAVCVLTFGAPALATGIIGSISGVQEGEDIFDANQGLITGAGLEEVPQAEPTGEATEAPGAVDVPTAEPTGEGMSAMAQELYLRLSDESPIQEGWHIQFSGESVLTMLAAPDLMVWNIQPESGIMELLWYRDLHDFLSDSEGNPLVEVSPDGTRAIIVPSDGAIYMIDATNTQQIAPAGTAPGRVIWTEDSASYAYIVEDEIHAFTQGGAELVIEGDVILPVGSELEWLNPGETPEALAELISSEEWTYAGTSEACVLFDKADGSASCAYLIDSGTVVNYPEAIYSSMTIGRSGACPLYDSSAERYRLYLSDGSYADIPMLDVINEGEMANPYGWLGDSICVLEQDVSSRSAFRLHAANTATGITYTLLTPWEYAEMMNGQTDD